MKNPNKITISDIKKARQNASWGTKAYEDCIDLLIDKIEELEKRINNIQYDCPYSGVLFSNVPGYKDGYGCPVCKGLSYHLKISA